MFPKIQINPSSKILIKSSSLLKTAETLPIPKTIDNLSFWIDATTGLYDATTGGNLVTTNDSQIARWEDQSGNNRHVIQPTTNSRPVVKTAARNGNDIVYFDGSNDWVYGSEDDRFLNNLPRTMFAVVQLDSSVSNRREFFGTRGGSLGDADEGGQIFGFNNPTFGSGVFCSNIAEGGVSITQTNETNWSFGLYETVTTSTNLELSRHFGSSSSSAIGIRDGYRVKVGSGQGNAYFFKGNVAEILTYERVLTEQEKTTIRTYLVNKWFLSPYTLYLNAATLDDYQAEAVGDATTSGNSLSFDGSGDLYRVSKSYFPTTSTSWTVDFWVNFNDFSDIRGIASVSDQMTMEVDNSGQTLRLYWRSPGVWSTYEASVNLVVGSWYHIAMSVDDLTLRMFVNGENVYEALMSSVGEAGPQQTQYLYIGGIDYYPFGGSVDYYLNGFLENFRIADGISLYNSNFIPPSR